MPCALIESVVTQLHEKHRHQEFLTFLHEIEEKIRKELDAHVVLDKLGTSITPKVRGGSLTPQIMSYRLKEPLVKLAFR